MATTTATAADVEMTRPSKLIPEDVDWGSPIAAEPFYLAFDRAAARQPGASCIDFMGRITTYGEMAQQIEKAARGLQNIGVEKGDRVGILLPNTPYYVIMFHAILKVGGTVVNFNPLYAEEELTNQMNDSGAKVMVTLDLELMLPKLLKSAQGTPVEKIVVCSMAKCLPSLKGILFKLFKGKDVAAIPQDGRCVTYESLTADIKAPDAVGIDPETDLAVLQYTGGTTGIPKGAALTHYNLVANRSQVVRWDPEIVHGGEKVLGVLPFFHVFAMTVVMSQSIEIGAEMILLPRFELELALKTINRRKPTIFPGVPTLFNAINNFPDLNKYDLTSLKTCISGGAPLPLEVKHRFEGMTGCKLVEGYGLTEGSPVLSCNPVHGVSKEGSIGLAFPRTEIEIRDREDTSKVMAQGEDGEICARGPQIMSGYWQRPDATAETLVDGWLRTGDVGYQDEDGYIFIIDRQKDLILCNGYNVYPRVIEEAIYQHDSVEEVTVIGLPDDDRGQVPKAFVKLRSDESLNEGELREFLKKKISPIEMPREIEFREELPKTMIGKLSKKELVQEEMEKRGLSA
ncbi:long-chain-fatty-acid--CoA ligase [Rhodovibrionaceae bacterium A322]